MRTVRVTFLTTPDRKAAIEARAARLGVSSGELVRLAVDSFDELEPGDEQLAAVVAEVSAAIPRIRASLDRSSERLEATHRKVDAFLREAGVRR